jgi:AraC family transcriptional regulator
MFLRPPSVKQRVRMEGQLSRARVSLATGQLEAAPAAVLALSSGSAWKGFRLDHLTRAPAEEDEGYLKHHSVVVHTGPAVEIEICSPGEEPRTAALRRGDVLVLPARVPYRVRWREPWELLVVRLSEGGADSLFREAPSNLVSMVVATGDALLRELILALRAEAQRGPAGGELYAESLGSALAAHLVRSYGQPSGEALHKGGLPRRRLKELREYVEEHLGAPLHLPQLADLAGASVRQFARAFKESTSLTPHQFVLHRRIERAKALLTESSLTIGEIAAACGFASASRFTAAFRRVTRATPTAWRTDR